MCAFIQQQERVRAHKLREREREGGQQARAFAFSDRFASFQPLPPPNIILDLE